MMKEFDVVYEYLNALNSARKRNVHEHNVPTWASGYIQAREETCKELEQSNAEIKDLESKLAIAVETLEFYADRSKWNCFYSQSEVKDVITISDVSAKNHVTNTHYMIPSGGNRARQALKEFKARSE